MEISEVLKKDLSIIIVSWNSRDLLRRNLTKIQDGDNKASLEVIVVDNASVDGSADMVREEFPWVTLLANSENLGFAKANNQAIRRSSGRYILLFNPDMIVYSDTLSAMVGWMDANPQAGIAGCRLKSENGDDIRHVRRFPRLFDQLMIVLKLPHLFPGLLGGYLQKGFDYSREAEVDSVRGSFFMIRRAALDQVGLLDERFFIWFEEVDYCRRARQAGWKVVYTPQAECIDLVGRSFAQVKTGKTQKYFRDSMLKYFRKWHPAWQYAILYLAWPIGMGMAVAITKARKLDSRAGRE